MNDRRIISFDWAVKRMLRDKANFAVLEGLFKVLIGRDMRIVEILESEGNQEEATDKFRSNSVRLLPEGRKNRVDVKAKDDNGDIIIVEVQVTRQIHYLERILYGVSKAITEHIALGDDYDKVKKVYSINILYFDFGEGTDYLYHGTTQFMGVHTHDKLSISTRENNVVTLTTPADIFPEYFLIRVNEFNQVATTPIEEWLDYLKNQHIRPDTTAPGLQEARQRLEVMTMPTEERQAYERHLQNLMLEKDAIKTAYDDAYMDMAIKMVNKGEDPAKIFEYTGIEPASQQLLKGRKPTR